MLEKNMCPYHPILRTMPISEGYNNYAALSVCLYRSAPDLQSPTCLEAVSAKKAGASGANFLRRNSNLLLKPRTRKRRQDNAVHLNRYDNPERSDKYPTMPLRRTKIPPHDHTYLGLQELPGNSAL